MPEVVVTIVIPCFNAGDTLAAAIESARDQELGDSETIVVDDGSTDGSLAVARRFEPGVRVVTGANRGASAARNRGIAETGGMWIVFLDADDLLLPGTLAKRLDVAAASDADIVVCDWREDRGDGPEPQVRYVDMDALESDPEVACATHFWATTAALMYRRGLVDRIGGFRDDLPVIQDARFLFDAACHGARFARSAHIGAIHRVRPGSLSRGDPARFCRDLLENGRQIEERWRARSPLTERQREALSGMFDLAARGLFAAGDPAYFAALARQRALGLPLTRHPRIAGPLARAVGLGPARQLLRLVGR